MDENAKIPEKVVNPLLARIQMPGETFTLPSGGIFYTNGELDSSVQNAEIHVYPMTAIDEITIKTPDLLFSGEAVKQVFARCIPQVKNSSALLTKDVDFLMVCLRKVSYGDDLRLEHTHDCTGAKMHTYTVNVSQFIQNTKRIDPTTISKKFVVEMPNKQQVHMQPIRFVDFVRIMQTSKPDENTNPAALRDLMVESFAGIITKVDEVDDKGMIKEWLATVSPQFLTLINNQVDKTLEWGPEFTLKVICKDCGKETELVAPMNPLYFFT